ncbi:MAG: hypothetical protein ABIM99_05970 [Candidatus Dojkabacteria bacterium]
MDTTSAITGTTITPLETTTNEMPMAIQPEPIENKDTELIIPAIEIETIPIQSVEVPKINGLNSETETLPVVEDRKIIPAIEAKTELVTSPIVTTISAPTTSEKLAVQDPEIVKALPQKSGKKKLALIIPLIIIVLIIAAGVATYIYLNQKNNNSFQESNIPQQDASIVSSPTGDSIRKFVGRLYDISFNYPSTLGLAKSVTSKNASSSGECKIEDITFSGDTNLFFTISTGSCTGGIIGSPDFQKVSSADGKSFFIVVKKLDETLFPGKSTLSVSGGVDTTNNFVSEQIGVRIDAIRIDDVSKYQKYINDILSTMKVTLSPLKSEIFDVTNDL